MRGGREPHGTWQAGETAVAQERLAVLDLDDPQALAEHGRQVCSRQPHRELDDQGIAGAGEPDGAQSKGRCRHHPLGAIKLNIPATWEEDQGVVARVAQQVPVLRLEAAQAGQAAWRPAHGERPVLAHKQR